MAPGKGPDSLPPAKVEGAKKDVQAVLADFKANCEDRCDLADRVLEKPDVRVVFQRQFGSGGFDVKDSERLKVVDQGRAYVLIAGTDRVALSPARRNADGSVSPAPKDWSEEHQKRPDAEWKEFSEMKENAEVWYALMKSAAEFFVNNKSKIDYSSFFSTSEQAERLERAVLCISLAGKGEEQIDATYGSWIEGAKMMNVSEEDLYGEAGAVNLLITLRRVMAGFPSAGYENDEHSYYSRSNNQRFTKLDDFEVYNIPRIVLKLGEKRGNHPEDRYGIITETALDAEQPVIEEKKVPTESLDDVLPPQ